MVEEYSLWSSQYLIFPLRIIVECSTSLDLERVKKYIYIYNIIWSVLTRTKILVESLQPLHPNQYDHFIGEYIHMNLAFARNMQMKGVSSS